MDKVKVFPSNDRKVRPSQLTLADLAAKDRSPPLVLIVTNGPERLFVTMSQCRSCSLLSGR